MLDVPEQTLMNELNKRLRQRFSRNTKTPTAFIPETEEKREISEQIKIDPLDMAAHEEHLMRVLLLYGNYTIQIKDPDGEVDWEGTVAEYIINDLEHEQIKFENDIFNEMLAEYLSAREKGLEVDEMYFINHARNKLAEATIELIANQHNLSENWKRNKIYVKSEQDQLSNLTIASVLSLKSRLIGKQLKQLIEDMKVTEDDGQIFILQQQFFELKSIANEIDDVLSRTFNY
jgi:DNA primase